jgi:glutamate synthase (NADPH/NADH) small chain
MLKFVTVGKEMPEKRDADKPYRDFDEIYGEYAREKAAEQAGAAASAACPIASPIARCTTTSPIG